MIANHRRNLERAVKIETLSIFPICRRSSQTIWDVYDFQFSFGEIWDGRQKMKSSILLDFPDIWKPVLAHDA